METPIPLTAHCSATIQVGSRDDYRFIGTAETPDGVRYRIGVHRTEHYPVLIHVSSDILIKLTWEFLVTVAADGNLHSLATPN